MGYIGRAPAIGSFKKLDALTFDGANTTFTLKSGGLNVVPGSPQNLLVSIGGVLQEPGVAYTLSGSSIIFSTAPTVAQPFFGVMLGDVLDVGYLSSNVSINVAQVTASGNAAFNANAAFAANTTMNGLLSVVGGQIKFPATQVPSADVNTLDDYEEGTWTPVIGGVTSQSGQTYASQVGLYVKIGSWVFVQFYVSLTAKGTITGGIEIKGLPFTSSGATNSYHGALFYFTATATNWITIFGQHGPSTTVMDLIGNQVAGVGYVAMAPTDIGNGTSFMGLHSYQSTG